MKEEPQRMILVYKAFLLGFVFFLFSGFATAQASLQLNALKTKGFSSQDQLAGEFIKALKDTSGDTLARKFTPISFWKYMCDTSVTANKGKDSICGTITDDRACFFDRYASGGLRHARVELDREHPGWTCDIDSVVMRKSQDKELNEAGFTTYTMKIYLHDKDFHSYAVSIHHVGELDDRWFIVEYEIFIL